MVYIWSYYVLYNAVEFAASTALGSFVIWETWMVNTYMALNGPGDGPGDGLLEELLSYCKCIQTLVNTPTTVSLHMYTALASKRSRYSYMQQR